MDGSVSLTRAEYDACRSELEALRHRREHDLPRLLREARTYATSDANEEAAQLREDFAFVERRIAALQELLASARVADGTDAPDVVVVGSRVTFEYVGAGRRSTCVVAGTGGGAPGTLSAGSPVGQALLGRRSGDAVEVELPNGRTERLRVLEVEPAEVERAA